MATRNPLIYSGNNLVEMTSGQMDSLIDNIVYLIKKETRKRFKNRRAGFRLERQVAKRRRSGCLVRKLTPTGSVSSKLAVSILRRSRSKRLTFVERREGWRERKREREMQ